MSRPDSHSDSSADRWSPPVVWGMLLVALALVVLSAVFFAVARAASPQEPGPDSSSASPSTAASATLPDSTASALPAGVSPQSGFGLGVVSDTFNPAVPTLELWEDFQCPDCKALDSSPAHATIDDLVASGDLNVVQHPVSFLDSRLGNDSSSRAAAAYGCAVDAGIGPAYLSAVFASQPSREGDGFSDALLASLARQVGLAPTALPAFDDCLSSGRYSSWAAESTKEFYAQGLKHVPSLVLDGQFIPWSLLGDQVQLRSTLTSGTVPTTS